MIRIGLVGCGGIAHRHIEGYRRELMGRADVVAGCDPNQETLDKFCDTHSVKSRFTSPQEMIASGEVDVISLLTPPAVRDDVIYPAFDAGVHVLVEKPFAERLSDAAGFVKAAERTGVKLAVGQQLRFKQNMIAIQEAISAGTLGDIRHIAHDHYYNRASTRGWRKDETRLEISIFSIHILDRIRTFAGVPPKTVSAVTRHWDPSVVGETFTHLRVEFENDAVGTMVSSWHALTLPESRLRIDGTLGSAISLSDSAVGDRATVRIQTSDGELQEQSFHEEQAMSHAMGRSMGHLLDAIETGTEPPHSGRDNLQTMEIVDGAYLSAERGEPVSVEELRVSAGGD
jgi:D-apiose dehydrogenase